MIRIQIFRGCDYIIGNIRYFINIIVHVSFTAEYRFRRFVDNACDIARRVLAELYNLDIQIDKTGG